VFHPDERRQDSRVAQKTLYFSGEAALLPSMEIRTKRLILREFTPTDIPAVEKYHANPDYRRFLPWEEETHANAAGFVTKCIEMAGDEKRRTYQFAITLLDGTMVGSSGLNLNANHPYEAHFASELDPAHWGRGYGSESCHAVIDFGFRTLQLHRIYSQVIAENRAAVRMLISTGMNREGLFRENRFFAGHWWDTLSYGMIARDWNHDPDIDHSNHSHNKPTR
jgi:[ribosomal protein S5]-alanine N-acetyltransferase